MKYSVSPQKKVLVRWGKNYWISHSSLRLSHNWRWPWKSCSAIDRNSLLVIKSRPNYHNLLYFLFLLISIRCRTSTLNIPLVSLINFLPNSPLGLFIKLSLNFPIGAPLSLQCNRIIYLLIWISLSLLFSFILDLSPPFYFWIPLRLNYILILLCYIHLDLSCLRYTLWVQDT